MLFITNGCIKPMVGKDIPNGSVLIGGEAFTTIAGGKIVYQV